MANNPLPDAALAELDRLHAETGTSCDKWLKACIATFNAYQPMRQRLLDAESRLAEAERERDELREQLAAAQAMAEERGRALGGLHKASFDLRCVTALPFEMRVSDYQKAVEVLQHNLLTAEAALTTTPNEALDRAKREAVQEESRHWVDLIRRLDPMNLCDFIAEVGEEEHLRDWLDRASREAAAEVWEEIATQIKERGIGRTFSPDLGLMAEYLRRAAELRGGK